MHFVYIISAKKVKKRANDCMKKVKINKKHLKFNAKSDIIYLDIERRIYEKKNI